MSEHTDGLTAHIEQLRGGDYEITLRSNGAAYGKRTRLLTFSYRGAVRKAKKMLARERAYLNSQTEWVIK